MEKDFSKKVMDKLGQYFNIQSEVKTECKNYRIDYIINDKQNEDVFWGIEFKDLDYKRGEGMGSHVFQAMKYSVSNFEIKENTYRRIPVMICPPLSYNYLMCPLHESKMMAKSYYRQQQEEYFQDRHNKNCSHHTLNGFLGALNIGEIRTTIKNGKQYIYFSFSNKELWTNNPIWNTDLITGLDKNNYEQLILKINNFNL